MTLNGLYLVGHSLLSAGDVTHGLFVSIMAFAAANVHDRFAPHFE